LIIWCCCRSWPRRVCARTQRCLALDDEQIGTVEARVLERAGEQTPAQFRQSVKRAVARVDTRAAEERHAAAKRDRTVALHPLADGMVGIWSVHTATDAEAIIARLRDLAGPTAEPGDERTIGEREADALISCVHGTCGEDGEQAPGGAPRCSS